MADIFQSGPGIVAIFPAQKVLPGLIHLPEFQPQAALISGIDYNQRTNQQFQPTLDGSVFIYVFGDMMGDVAVNGKAFPGMCDNSKVGLQEVFEFYAKNRASKRATPVTVVVGEETVVGFLTELRIRGNVLAEEPIAAINDYTLIISALPKR